MKNLRNNIGVSLVILSGFLGILSVVFFLGYCQTTEHENQAVFKLLDAIHWKYVMEETFLGRFDETSNITGFYFSLGVIAIILFIAISLMRPSKSRSILH